MIIFFPLDPPLGTRIHASFELMKICIHQVPPANKKQQYNNKYKEMQQNDNLQ